MKVALCFSGGIRNLKDNYESIKRCLIEPLNADVFIHGWYFKPDELENTHKIYRKEETSESKVQMLLRPKKSKLEVYDSKKEAEMKLKFKIDEIKEKYKENEYLSQLFPNTVGMFWSIYQSNELKKSYEREKNFKYDIVIRCRPDFEYYTVLTKDILNLVKKDTILMPLDNYAFFTKKCDKFAIGDSESMDKYSDVILSILEYENKYPKEFWDGPNVLDIHLKKNKIKTLWIYIDYEYHIRRKNQRLTDDKRRVIDYDVKSKLITKPKKYNG